MKVLHNFSTFSSKFLKFLQDLLMFLHNIYFKGESYGSIFNVSKERLLSIVPRKLLEPSVFVRRANLEKHRHDLQGLRKCPSHLMASLLIVRCAESLRRIWRSGKHIIGPGILSLKMFLTNLR